MSVKTRIAALVLAVLASLGTFAVGVSPASAATSLTFCFQWSTGAAYASQPVTLQVWNGSSWVAARSGKTASNGCATFSNVPSNAYTTVKAATVLVNGQVWIGWSPYYANPGTGGANIGKGIVYMV